MFYPFLRGGEHMCLLCNNCVLSRTMHKETIITLLTLLFSKAACKIMINCGLILIYTHWTPEQYVLGAKILFQILLNHITRSFFSLKSELKKCK